MIALAARLIVGWLGLGALLLLLAPLGAIFVAGLWLGSC